MVGSLLVQPDVGQHACMGRPSLSKNGSHAIVLLACFQGPVVRRRCRSSRVLVSQELESVRRSVVSVRSD